MEEAIKLDDLKKINDWIQHRLSSGSRPRDNGNKNIDTKQLLRDFIQGKIVAMKRYVGCVSCRAVTVRSEFRRSQEYLRPDYSFPDNLSPLLDQPEFQKPFSFDFQPVGDQRPFTPEMPISPEIGTELPDTFVALHRVERVGGQDGPPQRVDGDLYFSARINKFWAQLEDAQYPDVKDAYLDPEDLEGDFGDSNLYCIFAAQNGSDSTAKLKPKHIAAVYFIGSSDLIEIQSEAGKLDGLLELASQLFEGLALIEKIDSALFQLEGLQLVAKLLPHFSDENMAPADKVALGLEELKRILSDHIVGRTFEGEPPNLFYLSCVFEKTSDQTFIPRLSLYPLIYRNQHQLAASQVSHKNIASVGKLLLKQYLEAKNSEIVFGRSDGEPVVLDSSFLNVLDPTHLDIPPYSDWLKFAWSKNRPDIIHMVEHDTRLSFLDSGKRAPWEAFNRPSTPDDKNKAIVAYVVESEKKERNGIEYRGLPRGIIAIESKYVAAFSDADVKGLEVVLSGFSSLIRTVTHQNSPVDYRSQLKQAFDRFLPSDTDLNDLEPEDMLSLVFLAHTLDAQEAMETYQKIREVESTSPDTFEDFLSNSYDMSAKALNLVGDIVSKLDPTKDEDLSDRQAALHIELRLKHIQKFMTELKDDEGLNEALRFLESCSENFLWANYLYSFGQALGDRVNQTIPEFHFMRPGFSASQMFMAVVKNELKQVVKLASKDKLDKERDKYLNYVRYRVVNAARIPVTAYAFDSDGTKGSDLGTQNHDRIAEDKYRRPFGVLVSDLVFAKDSNKNQVSTLISALVSYFMARSNPKSAPAEPNVTVIEEQLRSLFNESLELWKEAIEPLTTKRLHEAVRLSFRLPKRSSIAKPSSKDLKKPRSEVDQELARVLDLYDTYRQFQEFCRNAGEAGDGFRSAWNAKGLTNCPGQPSILRELSAVTHGDLNARNLAWAEGLKSFFLIDFEHVGDSLAGTDQCRLAVNLVTEIFGAYLERTGRLGPKTKLNLLEVPDIMGEIDTVLLELPRLVSELLLGGKTGTLEIIENLAPASNSKGKELWGLIVAVLRTLPVDRGRTNDESVETHNYIWGYSLFCSCLKEFEYSVRSIGPDELSDILLVARKQSKNLHMMSASELYNFLWVDKALGESPSKDLLGQVFRYFVAGKLLYGVVQDSE